MIAGLPYDAEVEYLESTGTQWIDTGVPPTNTQRYVFQGCYNTTTINQAFIASYSTSSSTPYYLPSFINANLPGFGVQTGGMSAYATYGSKDTYGHVFDIDFQNYTFKLDQTQYTIRTQISFSANHNNYFLFAANVNGTGIERQTRGKLYYFELYDNGVLVRDFRPVRFTNELGQSEGAMYDRVSRKLFRNAGTGAFTIGPDVATPVMGLHFFKSQIKTAKDYVQNGLIAMWDGIENVGYGQHDDNATSWADLTGGGANWLLKDSNTTEVFEVGSDYVKILNGVNYSRRGHCTPSWSSGDDVVTVEIVLDNGDFDTGGSAMARVANFGIGNGNTFPAVCLVGTKFTHVKYNQYPKFDIGVGCSSISLVYNEQKVFLNGVSILSDKATDGGYTYFAPCISAYAATAAIGTKIKSMRIYSRVLTDAERLANYAVDKRRFNLP